MRRKPTIPVNTIDQALSLARTLSQDLAKKESQAKRSFRIFSVLVPNRLEALAAFFIWRARGETIKELTKQK
jgi:hypothetical protein